MVAPAKWPGSVRSRDARRVLISTMLVGRGHEMAQLAEAVEHGRRGSASSWLIRGEPGIGKTVLLDAVASGARGAIVLRTQGLEVERPLPFAALQRLLRPVMRVRDRLPGPQSHALGIAFGEESGETVEPFMVGVATLGLITAAAEEDFVLCCIDDAQWLDAASADALLFCARRLGADRVVMLFTARDESTWAVRDPAISEMTLSGLDVEAAAELVERVGGTEGAADVVNRLVSDTRGNPLALLELAGQLSPPELDGSAQLPARLPLTSHLEDLFLATIQSLSAETRELLLLIAADESGAVSVIRHAAKALGLHDAAFEEARRSGLLPPAAQTIALRHPLIRSAVYQSATEADRRRAHGVLAEAHSASGDRERAIWHRAAAAEEADPELSAALEEVGSGARRRGAHAAAADAFARAAELCDDGARRGVLAFEAARSAWANGQSARARALLADADEAARDPRVLADIVRLRGHIEVNLGSAVLAHRLFIEAARAVADVDGGRALELRLLAETLRAFGADSGSRIGDEDRPPALTAVDSTRTRCLKEMFASMRSSVDGDIAGAIAALHRAVDMAAEVDDREMLWNMGNAALQLGDDRLHRRCYGLALARAREAGAVTAIVYVLQRSCFGDYVAGDLLAVRRSAEDALALSTHISRGETTALPLAWLTVLAAFQGSTEYESRLADVQSALENAHGILADPARDLTRWAQGVHAAAEGNRPEAFHHLSRIRVPAVARMAALDRLDSGVRADELERATEWLVELEAFADASQHAWARAAAQYGRALCAGDAAEEHFEHALREYSTSDRPLDEARTQLAYGEWLRRTGRRVDARRHLRRALETFQDAHIEYLAERAAQELRASGENARKRDPSTLVKFTPMELKIAQLVSSGMSNKEAAAACWVSPRTVAFHLRNVFAKAGITSRSELARLDLV